VVLTRAGSSIVDDAGSTDETSSLEVDGMLEGIGSSLDEPTCISEPAIVSLGI
jgi:hypothetical protein